jgi:hypothetical protein
MASGRRAERCGPGMMIMMVPPGALAEHDGRGGRPWPGHLEPSRRQANRVGANREYWEHGEAIAIWDSMCNHKFSLVADTVED